MSFERAVFAPVERAANILHPYRWRLCLGTFALFLLPFVLVVVGQLGAQELSLRLLAVLAPPLVVLIAWSWGAFLLAMWFGPSGFASQPRGGVLSARGALVLSARVWGLIVLSVFVLGPVAYFIVMAMRGL